MKKIVNILGKIILITCIILIMIYIISFIVGIFDSYNNGETKTFLFGGSIFGPNDTVYGEETINLFLSKFHFGFCIISLYGIMPSICIPIFVAILLRFKKIFTKNILKYTIILLLICIICHIIFLKQNYDTGLIILPYIESVIISYLIARVIFKFSSKK